METTHDNRPSAPDLGTALGDLLQEIGLAVVVGLLGAAVLLWLFAKLADEVFSQEVTGLDNGIALGLHSLANPFLDAVFTFFTTVGGVLGVLAIALVAFVGLAWRRHYHSAWRVALAVAGGVLLNEVLKQVFQRPRPALWPHAAAASYSFPSGHATAALCLFGMLLALGWRLLPSAAARGAWAGLMVFLILMIGLSRIYLGVHYPSDVLAGYLSGGFWLAMLITGSDLLARLRGRRAGSSGTAPRA